MYQGITDFQNNCTVQNWATIPDTTPQLRNNNRCSVTLFNSKNKLFGRHEFLRTYIWSQDAHRCWKKQSTCNHSAYLLFLSFYCRRFGCCFQGFGWWAFVSVKFVDGRPWHGDRCLFLIFWVNCEDFGNVYLQFDGRICCFVIVDLRQLLLKFSFAYEAVLRKDLFIWALFVHTVYFFL